MNSKIEKNKLFIPLFFLPLTYIIGIAVVEVFLFFYLFFLFLNDNNKKLLDQKILIILFLFSFYIGVNAFLQIPSTLKSFDQVIKLKYSSILHFRYVLFSIAVFFFLKSILI